MSEHALPAPPAKPPHYELAVVHGKIAYVSGQVSRMADRIISGHLAENDDIAEAQNAARASIRRCLSVLQDKLGSLDRIERVLAVRGFVSAAPEFKRHPEVMDAASQLLKEYLGDRAGHARSTLGVASIPGGGLVEIEMTVALT
jgi:enamine deaminase RidA (YjgF/YER057c/UK114 family)